MRLEDISATRVLRDAGMEMAASHADAVVEGWSDMAYAFLVDSILTEFGE